MTELQEKPHSSSLHGFTALPKIFPEEINMMPNLVALETQRQRWLFAANVVFQTVTTEAILIYIFGGRCPEQNLKMRADL